MDSHLRIGSSQDLYHQCGGVWTENFALKDKIGAHIRSTPPNYMNCCRCEVCGKLFSRISDLKTHLWVHTTKEKPFACDICNKTFGSLNSKNSHRRKVHRGELSGGSPGTPNSSSAAHHHSQQQMQVVSQVHSSCHMQQGEMAHSRSPNETHAHLQQASPASHSHLQQPQHAHSQSQQHPHPSSQPHSLQQASGAAVHRPGSHAHHSHDHCHNPNETSANRKHSPPCDVCGKTFAFTNYIKLHQTVHTKEKPFSCDLCPKRFSQPSSRNRHRKKSHKQENCEIGPLSLAPSHHGQSAGGNANPTPSGTQQQHQSKKNSPPCEVCGKTFAFKNYLKAHYRVHSKEKPYVCDLCFRRFTQASSRNFHRKRMHKEASLIEPTPQQMAMQPPVTPNLQSSSTSSHDQKPFHCKACVPTYHPTYDKQ